MPRVYKRKPGSRSYLTNYSDEDLRKALSYHKSCGVTLKMAADKYNVPYSTLQRKYTALPTKKPGGQTCLTEETEVLLLKTISTMTDWRVPVDSLDIRLLVKKYLDKRGISEKRFSDNLPGIDWVRSFMKRHQLTKRVADNVKSNRALVNSDVINSYFDNLEVELRGIPPENIFNYDEMNITDDPGSKSVIVKRGHGHRVERKLDHSKQSTSVMFAGNASGRFLPPMIVYKALNLYRGWTEGGPYGAVYDVTKNGWFDGSTFERWFFEVFIPGTVNNTGTK